MKLFEYVIMYSPSESTNNNKKSNTKAEVPSVLKKGEVIAKEMKNAEIMVYKQIPDDYMNCLDQVSVAIRPF